LTYYESVHGNITIEFWPSTTRDEQTNKMVFFTAILIVVILYYFQGDGLVYVTIIALIAELINIFMTHSVIKSVEKRLTTQHKRIIIRYTNRLKAYRNTIKEFERVQEESVTTLYNANMKIKKYEEEIAEYKAGSDMKETNQPPLPEKPPVAPSVPPPIENPTPRKEYDDLPDGSNRRKNGTPHRDVK
jgi:hypothetical protein